MILDIFLNNLIFLSLMEIISSMKTIGGLKPLIEFPADSKGLLQNKILVENFIEVLFLLNFRWYSEKSWPHIWLFFSDVVLELIRIGTCWCSFRESFEFNRIFHKFPEESNGSKFDCRRFSTNIIRVQRFNFCLLIHGYHLASIFWKHQKYWKKLYKQTAYPPPIKINVEHGHKRASENANCVFPINDGPTMEAYDNMGEFRDRYWHYIHYQWAWSIFSFKLFK